jgi:hypothetical protein
LGVGATINFVAPGCHGLSDGPVGVPVDVTFDNPAAVDTATSYDPSQASLGSLPPNGSGNIAAFACDTINDTTCNIDANMFRSRRFPVAGIYHYHSSLYPSDTFTIIIKKD